MMKDITKPTVCAEVEVIHNKENTGLFISAELPGVEKSDLKLNVSSESFCVAGERNDLKYDCCYQLPHEVDEKNSVAKFENGLLTVDIPFKTPVRGLEIEIL